MKNASGEVLPLFKVDHNSGLADIGYSAVNSKVLLIDVLLAKNYTQNSLLVKNNPEIENVVYNALLLSMYQQEKKNEAQLIQQIILKKQELSFLRQERERARRNLTDITTSQRSL